MAEPDAPQSDTPEAPSEAAAPAPAAPASEQPAAPAPQAQPAQPAPPTPASEAAASGAELPAAPDDQVKVAAKTLGLFVILAVICGWNTFCLMKMVPKVAQLLNKHKVVIDDHQQHFINASEQLNANPNLLLIPIGALMLLGLACLFSRWWSLFSGIFFTLIVLLFMLFLYGWLVFATSLHQLSRPDVSDQPASTYKNRIEVEVREPEGN